MSSLIPTDKLTSIAFRIGMIVLVLATFTGIGLYFGSALASSSWKGKLAEERSISSKIIYAKEGETQQCRGQVDEINRVHSDLARRVAEDAVEDKQARDAANREAQARALASQKRNETVIAALKDIRDEIDNGNFEPCTSTLADSNFIGLLNEAITANRSGYAGRDSDSPASETDH